MTRIVIVTPQIPVSIKETDDLDWSSAERAAIEKVRALPDDELLALVRESLSSEESEERPRDFAELAEDQ